MPLELVITPGTATPIYRQVVDQICRAVALGALAPGEQLPSVRTLAEQLVVNPNTVARSYADLVRDGILDSQRGRGFYVAQRRQVYTAAERLRRIEGPLDAFVSQALQAGCGAEEIRRALQQRLEEILPGSKEGGAAHGR